MKEIVILNLIAITLAAAVIIPLAMADTSSKEQSTAKAPDKAQHHAASHMR